MKKTIILIVLVVFQLTNIQAQDTSYRIINVNDLFRLTIQNNQSLKVASAAVDVAAQGVEVAKLQQLPTLSTSLSAGYLGNAQIIDKDFSKTTTVAMPHFANSFGLNASQLIFKGNVVRNSIAAASLQEQLATLYLERNTQDMKLLVAGNYFDLYKLYNQRKVYEQNILLAERRMKNIQKMYEQGMVTRNDIIRSELQISNLRLAVGVVNNNINIINKQLTTVTGLPSTTYILPDTTLIANKPLASDFAIYQQDALTNHPDIRVAEKNTELAEKYLDITKAERMPALSAFAGNNLARPITSGAPLDKYSNAWQSGLTLLFDISSIYKTPKRIKQNQLQVEQYKEAEVLQQQNVNIAVNAAYVRHLEAIDQTNTLEKNRQLANENYRIIEKKYLNQLALLIDMLDATNQKLDAELQYTNAEINILYTYFQLLKSIGRL
jgi:outer membrane protein